MNVPEWVDEMCMVEMGVYTEHLTPSGSHVTKERLGEASALADPVLGCKIRESTTKGSWTRCNGLPTLLFGAGRRGVAALERRSSASEGGIGRERDRVVDFTDNPALDERNILASWDGDRLTFVVKPGVDVMASETLASSLTGIGLMCSDD